MTESGDKPGADDTSGSENPSASSTSGSDLTSESSARSQPEFGSAFDYDATAEASLSAPPATSDIGPVTGATGSGSGSGPGWSVHSGVGNGPGWGETPSYPPPSNPGSAAFPDNDDDEPSHPGSGYQQGWAKPQAGPVYGPPDPNYGQPYQQYEQYQGYPPPNPGYGGQSSYGGQPSYGPPGYPTPSAYPGGYYGVDPAAPYGRHPVTGEPYSDKSKLTAGLLGILLGPFGAGRFYLDQPGMAVAQIAVTWLTCGLGGIWPLIDGIMMLVGNVRDKNGRPLRD